MTCRRNDGDLLVPHLRLPGEPKHAPTGVWRGRRERKHRSPHATIVQMPDKLPWTGDDDADRLLASQPLALLIGMLLDQQFPMERAFAGPHILQIRLGRPLDAEDIAEVPEDDLVDIFRGPPAIHRYPASMAKRTQALCRMIVDEHQGDAANVWEEATDAKDLYRRLRALPGYGEAKARIFVGILGKRLGVAPDGWEEQAADWASIADVASFDDIAELREAKRLAKESAKN